MVAAAAPPVIRPCAGDLSKRSPRFSGKAPNRQVLDDLARIDPERWTLSSYEALLENPQGEIRRLCAFADIPFRFEFAGLVG